MKVGRGFVGADVGQPHQSYAGCSSRRVERESLRNTLWRRRITRRHGAIPYETLSEDLAALLDGLDLRDVTLVGFSMGGGEVATYCARMGVARLRSVVFASSVTPFMLHTKDNPDGPLSIKAAAHLAASLTKNQDAFYDQFVTDFFSVGGELKVGDDAHKAALDMCHEAGKAAALACMSSFGKTDFREDLPKVTTPSLVIHGDSDATVPFEGLGKRTHEALPGSRLHLIANAPHGLNVSHAEEFNAAMLDFLAEDFAG